MQGVSMYAPALVVRLAPSAFRCGLGAVENGAWAAAVGAGATFLNRALRLNVAGLAVADVVGLTPTHRFGGSPAVGD